MKTFSEDMIEKRIKNREKKRSYKQRPDFDLFLDGKKRRNDRNDCIIQSKLNRVKCCHDVVLLGEEEL